MKKAKLMLSALGLVAALSTAFAFSANRYSTHFIYTGGAGTGSCTNLANGKALANTTNGSDPVVAASIASTTTGCPDQFTVTILD